MPLVSKNRRINHRKSESYEIDYKILQGLEAGKTQVQIAKELHMTHQGVGKRINRMIERGLDMSEIWKKKIQNDEVNSKILEGLKAGKTKSEIAKELSLSIHAIMRRINKMKEYGVEIPYILRRKKENDIIDIKILEGLKAGKTQMEIAKKLKISQAAVSYRITRMKGEGIEIPKVPRKKKSELKEVEKLELESETNETQVNKSSKTDQELARMIVKLMYTKNATLEQIKVIGDYYGVNLDKALKELDEQER